MKNVTQSSDLLYVFTGVSSAQIADVLKTALNKRGDLEAGLAEWLTQRPLESMASFLLSASAAFYLAERGTNPKIQTFVDALYYISACLSAGDTGIFAQTQTGKLIVTLAVTLGPALTSNALDRPGRIEPASAEGQQLMLQRLDAILEELRRQRVEKPDGLGA